MHTPFEFVANGWGMTFPGWFPVFFVPVILWSFFWKGLALWHSGRRGEAWWFVILLVVNTFGILEIVYLFIVIKLKPSQLFERSAFVIQNHTEHHQ